MTESLSVNPDDLRTAAANVADISSEMKQVLSTLKGQLFALGSPWGNDSTGDQFANGSNGYLAQVDNVDSSIDATTQQLDSLSQSLTSAASNFEHQDQQTGGGTGNVLLGTGSGGGSGGSGGGSGSSGGSGSGSGSGGSGGSTGSGGGSNGPTQPLLPRLFESALPQVPAEAPVGQLTPRIEGTLLPETPGVPAQPAQPAMPAGNVLAQSNLSEGSPLLPETPGAPAQPAQPAVNTGNVLASGASAGATTPSATSPLTPAATVPAQPASAAGNVLASVVPGAGASGSGSGLDALIQTLEQLAQPAGEGVSAAMGAVHSGSTGSGAPGGPAST